MIKIAILSDTHSLLRPEVEEVLKDVDYILHAGDIASAEIYEQIKGYAESYFVRGNADKEWAAKIPADVEVEIGGFRFYMVHNIKHAKKNLEKVDFLVYGHSHKYENRTICMEGTDAQLVYLNPGSCGPRRFTQPVTMMVMTIDEGQGTFQIEKKDFSPILKKGSKIPSAKEMDKLIKNIIKDMDANRTVEQIAERNRVENDFVKEILQIYTTHPGIDIDGILNRMK